MKTSKLLFVACFVISSMLCAQNSQALQLVNKYSGKEGFTTVTISKSLFKMLSKVNVNDPDYQKIKQFSNRINSFKILVNENGNKQFKQEIQHLTNQLNSKNGYEELLSVQESANSIVRISAKEKNDSIQELILSVTDDTDNVLMVINGNFTLEELMEVSDDVEIGGLNQVKKAKKKS